MNIGKLSVAEINKLRHQIGGITSTETPYRDKDGPYRIYHVVNGTILGDKTKVGGILLNDEFTAIRESVNKDRLDYVANDAKCAALYYNDSSKKIECFEGEWAFLADGYATNFWHWMCECLPKIVILELTGYQGGYIVPNERFITDSLEMMKIAPERIRHLSTARADIAKLILFDGFDANGGRQTIAQNPVLISKIRSAMLHDPSRTTRKRIYIAREGTRSIVNESEFMTLIERYRFERVLMENHSLHEQIEMASQSECIIGPHGAGMALTMFMRPGSAVLELFPPTYIVPCMTDIAKHLKLCWFMVPSTNNPYAGGYPHEQRVKTDLNVIDQILDGILA